MNWFIEEKAREIPVRASADVLVCGGGVAGVTAAIAAARNGASVILVEHYGFPGGTNTAAEVSGVGGWQYDLDGYPLICGISSEIMKREAFLRTADPGSLDYLFKRIDKAPDYKGGGLGCFWVKTSKESMKNAMEDMLLESGVKIFYHTNAVQPIMDGNRVNGALIESKSGREAIIANVLVDCSGDGDMAARAGADSFYGRESDGIAQPMSSIFMAGASGNPRLHYDLNKEEDNDDPLSRDRYKGAIAFAVQRGEIKLNPNETFCAADIVDQRCPGIRSVNFTRIQKKSSLDIEALSLAEIEGRQQIRESINFIRRYVEGGEQAFLFSSAAQIGIRESRRIKGDYVLSAHDVENAADFEDSIARGIYLIDLHNPSGKQGKSMLKLLDAPYSIPYRSLLPAGLESILVAGRCISGDHIALASYRIQSHCMATGEAAGTAAALAVRNSCTPRKLQISRIQDALLKQGANPGPRFRK